VAETAPRAVAVRPVARPPAVPPVARPPAIRERGAVETRASRMAGHRETRRKQSVFHRVGTTGRVASAAVIVVAAVAVATYFVAPGSSGAGGAAAFEAFSNSKTLTALYKERQTIIAMNTAAQTMSVTRKVATVSPSQVLASEQASSDQTSSQSSTTVSEPTGPTPDPGSAESIGYAELADFGFSQSTQWGCLYNLWMRESGWVYDAENASGAYGIPQSLPASKMASAGSDYLTDPKTQIIWGLGYIQSTYGTPCNAWDFEEANGYY
jgi:hypothetical protein